jgi:isopentenyl-diphosphate delta-isomerase
MTSERKLSHLEICRDWDVTCRTKSTHLEDVELVHVAIPELDFEDIDLSTEIFGKMLSVPIIISAMTGGHPETERINRNLAVAAKDLGIGMGIGSQRAALEDAAMEASFRVVRELSGEMLVIANLGAAQLRTEGALGIATRAMEMVNADALAIHLNPLQELVQPNGDTRYRGVLDSIKILTRHLAKPVVVKETGSGISREVAESLLDSGVRAIDVAGAGGTSWAAVEHHNAKLQGDNLRADVAETLWDWGIPTAMSLCEVASIDPKPTVIASGGMQSGLDVAKSLALGADVAGVARKLLVPAFEGPDRVKEVLERMIYELKATAMLTGSKDIQDLQRARIVIKGDLLEWINQRGIRVRKNARG